MQQTLISGGAVATVKARCEVEMERIEKQFDECITFLLRVLLPSPFFVFLDPSILVSRGLSPLDIPPPIPTIGTSVDSVISIQFSYTVNGLMFGVRSVSLCFSLGADPLLQAECGALSSLG